MSHSYAHSISADFCTVSVGRASERAAWQARQLRVPCLRLPVCAKSRAAFTEYVLKFCVFFGFGDKKRLLWGSFGGVLVVFGGLWVV